MTRQLCSAGLAFIGFSASLIIGLMAENSYITVVSRALKVMMIFYMLGLFLSTVGVKVIQENYDQEIQRLELSQSQSEMTEAPTATEQFSTPDKRAIAEPVTVS